MRNNDNDLNDEYTVAMAEAFALGLTDMYGTATGRCQCPTCGEVFSTDSNFTRHLGGSSAERLSDDFEGPWCLDPATVGLIQTGGTCWHQPGPPEHLRKARRLAAATVKGGA